MKDLTIRNKKKQIYIWTLLGTVMLIIGIGSVFSEIDLGFSVGSGIVYLCTGLYYWYLPYIKVKNQELWVNNYPFRKVNLNEVTRVKQFYDETTLFANGKETRITTVQMSEEDQERFKALVNELKEHIQVVSINIT